MGLLNLTRVVSALWAYALLHQDAFFHRTTISEALQVLHPIPGLVPPLCCIQSWMLGAALLSFDFSSCAMACWLGAEYCSSNCNWIPTQARFNAAALVPPRPGYPTLYPNLAIRCLREGSLLQGHFADASVTLFGSISTATTLRCRTSCWLSAKKTLKPF